MEKLKWGIIGLGNIATQFAGAFNQEEGELYAVASRKLEKAQHFAAEFAIPKAFGDYHEMLADSELDIVYIATPHNFHIESMMDALHAGKHVLVEKAITLNLEELLPAVELAKEKNLILSEAMTIYHMPLYQKLAAEIKTGRFGKLKLIQANFGSLKEADPNNRFFNPDLAGGAILDIGVYALSFVRFFLSSAPTLVHSTMVPFETGVDESSTYLLRNPENELANVALTFRAKMPKQGVVVFEKGYFTINEYPRATHATFTYADGKELEWEEGAGQEALNYEVTDFQKMVRGELKNETLKWTTEVMSIMDQARAQW